MLPLCRRADGGGIDEGENRKLLRHILAGGVTTLLYGGNANFYHLPVAEYEAVLGFLAEAGEAAGPQTLVIPSVGPASGVIG